MQAGKHIDAADADGLADAVLWGQALGASAATEVGCVAGVTRANVQSIFNHQKDRLMRQTKVEKR
jgi:hypothetical protein